MRVCLTLSSLLLLVSSSASLAAPEPLVRDYCYFLHKLVDLESLPYLEDGVSCKQFSSYDRRSHEPEGWAANGDAGKYIRVEENGEAVMAEMPGPGCIFRIWSANPQGKIRFYLDGDTKPTYEFDFNEIFSGNLEPFRRPLVYKRGARQSASDCYLPIPYARSCKVTADKRHGQYYHIGYKTYPADTKLRTFRLPLTAEETRVLEQVCDQWSNCGRNPNALRPDTQRIHGQVTLQPGERVTLVDLNGPRVITSFAAKLHSSERYALRKVLLRGYWDNEQEPSIWSPLGDFFGTGWQENLYRSLPLGMTESEYYCYWPMPFRQRGLLEAINEGTKPCELSWHVGYHPERGMTPQTAYFHCKYRRESPSQVFDYPFLQCRGRGQFVGVHLSIDHPVPGWWGEGDEKVWVDGEDFPSTFGTGSEDYFGDAWGIRLLIQPLFACNYRAGTRTCCYRWHIPDSIPFTKSFKMTIENYPPYAEDYNSTAYWYQVEPNDDFFTPLSVAQRQPWGRSLPYALECEELFPAPGQAGLKIVNDFDLPYEFSHGHALDCGMRQVGETLPPARISAEREDAYYLTAYVGRTEDPAQFEAVLDGEALPVQSADLEKSGSVVFQGRWLEPGQHTLTFRVTKPGHLLLDCVQLARSPKERGVIEAENLKLQATSGPQVAVERATLSWSSGRQLLFPAAKVGDSITFDLPGRARGEHNLLARFTHGPDYGDVQAFAGGRPLGNPVSCYAETLRLGGPVSLGKVNLKPQGNEITLKVVGRAEKSRGYKVGLDYLRLQRPLVAGAIEGEHAKVLKAEGGAFGPQSLGGHWSGGVQLWFRGTRQGAYIVVETDVPKDGKYALDVYFTKSWDYARVQTYLDDRPAGKPVDTYAPTVVYAGKTSLGAFDLKQGRHRLKFEAVGHNPKSKGYYLGVDCWTLKPVR